ncbi:MAG: calcium-binding protein, partial [Paracoccaceae bacterium]
AAGFARHLGQALADAALPLTSDLRGVATAASDDPIHYAGSFRNDSFALAGTGLLQVLGNGGTDSVALAVRPTGVTVSMLSTSNHRVVGNTGGPDLLIDLILVETLRLTSGSDRVTMGGNLAEVHTFSGNDTVDGSATAERIVLGSGVDFAFGAGGNDLILGENGCDTLWGGTGDDQLFGGSSGDRLFGGAGRDTLTGGSEADQFVFFASEGNDCVTDFQNGVDKLWMRGQVWGDLRFVAMGADTLVQGLNHTVLLQNVTIGMLDSSDFLFSA